MREFTNSLAARADFLLAFFILLAAVVAAAGLIRYILRKNTERRGHVTEARQLYSFLSDNPFQVYVLVRGKDAFPLFVSDNVERILGLDKSDILTDVFAIARCMEAEESGKLEKLYRGWDRKEPLEVDFPYINRKNQKKGDAFLRVDYSAGTDVFTIVIEDITRRKEEEKKDKLKEKKPGKP